MMGSNAASWSHSEKYNNAVLKGFTFYLNDTINVEINMKDKKMLFQKKEGTENYKLNFKPIPNDELSPCVLLNHPGDTV